METQILSKNNQISHGMIFSSVNKHCDKQETLIAAENLFYNREANFNKAAFMENIEEHGAMLVSYTKTLLNISTEPASQFVENLFLDFWKNPENMSVDITHVSDFKIYLIAELRQRAFLYLKNKAFDDPLSSINNGKKTTLNKCELKNIMSFSLRSIIFLTLSVGLSFEDIAKLEGNSVVDIQRKYLEGIKLLKSLEPT